MQRNTISALAFMTLAIGGPCVPNDPVSPAAADPSVTEFVRLVDDVRRDARCPKLEWDEDVAEVARRHSVDMIQRGFFDHIDPGNRSPFDRLKAAGIPYHRAAENILHGTADARRALDLWMDSPGHRQNLVDCAYTHHGVGREAQHWTHVFITP
jgi:uncharacterized protein YkwD